MTDKDDPIHTKAEADLKDEENPSTTINVSFQPPTPQALTQTQTDAIGWILIMGNVDWFRKLPKEEQMRQAFEYAAAFNKVKGDFK